jgi:hypothetical protein
VYGPQAIDLFEPLNDEIDIVRIQFDAGAAFAVLTVLGLLSIRDRLRRLRLA